MATKQTSAPSANTNAPVVAITSTPNNADRIAAASLADSIKATERLDNLNKAIEAHLKTIRADIESIHAAETAVEQGSQHISRELIIMAREGLPLVLAEEHVTYNLAILRTLYAEADSSKRARKALLEMLEGEGMERQSAANVVEFTHLLVRNGYDEKAFDEKLGCFRVKPNHVIRIPDNRDFAIITEGERKDARGKRVKTYALATMVDDKGKRVPVTTVPLNMTTTAIANVRYDAAPDTKLSAEILSDTTIVDVQYARRAGRKTYVDEIKRQMKAPSGGEQRNATSAQGSGAKPANGAAPASTTPATSQPASAHASASGGATPAQPATPAPVNAERRDDHTDGKAAVDAAMDLTKAMSVIANAGEPARVLEWIRADKRNLECFNMVSAKIMAVQAMLNAARGTAKDSEARKAS